MKFQGAMHGEHAWHRGVNGRGQCEVVVGGMCGWGCTWWGGMHDKGGMHGRGCMARIRGMHGKDRGHAMAGGHTWNRGMVVGLFVAG